MDHRLPDLISDLPFYPLIPARAGIEIATTTMIAYCAGSPLARERAV
jgi:hypothetical protein